ncbi:uncharacterized protein ARMOST_06192 [Armillaria ostoyae]|uniref:Uncharacterized protein n=1 Tax=Armillaria ostoyae TaxID=47428 RepID=A0A284R2C5_ARMOS|nr:uncharacterized protein ARMOST_06192 [Armillaria ostoyae]
MAVTRSILMAKDTVTVMEPRSGQFVVGSRAAPRATALVTITTEEMLREDVVLISQWIKPAQAPFRILFLTMYTTAHLGAKRYVEPLLTTLLDVAIQKILPMVIFGRWSQLCPTESPVAITMPNWHNAQGTLRKKTDAYTGGAWNFLPASTLDEVDRGRNKGFIDS